MKKIKDDIKIAVLERALAENNSASRSFGRKFLDNNTLSPKHKQGTPISSDMGFEGHMEADQVVEMDQMQSAQEVC